jgi:secreted trypsin-like serine protease
MCSSVLTEFEKDWDSQICAGELDGSEDTCQGDSGGSLYVKDTIDGKSKFVTAGIVSYGVILKIYLFFIFFIKLF